MNEAHAPIRRWRLEGDGPPLIEETSSDVVAVEEPLTIRVRGRDDERVVLATTMRSPGDDLALAVGLCFAEGVLPTARHLLDVQACRREGHDLPAPGDPDEVLVTIDHPHVDLGHLHRHIVMSSACGVCGRTSLDDAAQRSRVVPPGDAEVAVDVLHAIPTLVRDRQEGFDLTGGLHAVALLTNDGHVVDVREDVGRHNAFDKVVGRAVRRMAIPLTGHVALLSGRASYELVAKAAVAGIGTVASIGAPSSLAIDVAQRCGITLVGFLRSDGGNVYSHPGRIGGAVRDAMVGVGS